MKNLIFATVGPKPQIVLRDAVANVIDITQGADRSIVYEQPLPDEGLHWSSHRRSAGGRPTTSGRTTSVSSAGTCAKRLSDSLASEPERLLFTPYTLDTGKTPTAQPYYPSFTPEDRPATAAAVLPRSRV